MRMLWRPPTAVGVVTLFAVVGLTYVSVRNEAARADRPGVITEANALLAVRTAHVGSFDEVVFEFRHEVPKFSVSRTGSASRRDTAAPVVVPGRVTIRVELAEGADVQTPSAVLGSGRITKVVFGGASGGLADWYIGVGGQRPFTVSSSSHPPRLAVQIG
jgi:hypothetical protein